MPPQRPDRTRRHPTRADETASRSRLPAAIWASPNVFGGTRTDRFRSSTALAWRNWSSASWAWRYRAPRSSNSTRRCACRESSCGTGDHRVFLCAHLCRSVGPERAKSLVRRIEVEDALDPGFAFRFPTPFAIGVALISRTSRQMIRRRFPIVRVDRFLPLSRQLVEHRCRGCQARLFKMRDIYAGVQRVQLRLQFLLLFRSTFRSASTSSAVSAPERSPARIWPRARSFSCNLASIRS